MIERMTGNAPQSVPHPANAAEYIRREKGKGMNKKGEARSDPPSRTARLACIGEAGCHKMNLPDKKGIGINGGTYGMIKGGLQKGIKQEYRDSAVRASCPDCRYRALAQSVENNHLVPMDCYFFAVWKPYNDFCAVVPDNLSVTDALAVFE